MAQEELKRMYVKDGIIYYEDNKEVTLWGINSGTPFLWRYKGNKEFGLDHKKVIDQDFEDFKKMGVECVRTYISVIEGISTIADQEGNLLNNIHLDLLDYMIYKCRENNMYLFLTAASGWGYQ